MEETKCIQLYTDNSSLVRKETLQLYTDRSYTNVSEFYTTHRVLLAQFHLKKKKNDNATEKNNLLHFFKGIYAIRKRLKYKCSKIKNQNK